MANEALEKEFNMIHGGSGSGSGSGGGSDGLPVVTAHTADPTPDNPLFDALYDNDIVGFRRLLDLYRLDEIDNSRDFEGYTLLYRACTIIRDSTGVAYRPRSKIVYKAAMDEVAKAGPTNEINYYHNIEFVRELLISGADPCVPAARDLNKGHCLSKPLLYELIDWKDIKHNYHIYDALLCSPEVDLADRCHATFFLLHEAAQRGDIVLVAMLLDHGADRTRLSECFKTPYRVFLDYHIPPSIYDKAFPGSKEEAEMLKSWDALLNTQSGAGIDVDRIATILRPIRQMFPIQETMDALYPKPKPKPKPKHAKVDVTRVSKRKGFRRKHQFY